MSFTVHSWTLLEYLFSSLIYTFFRCLGWLSSKIASGIKFYYLMILHSICCYSVTQSCPTLYESMHCSTPGLLVHHQLSEFTQTHVHWVGDAIQTPHPLSSPSPPAFNLSQPSGSFQMSQVFQSGSQTIAVSASASMLPMNIQDWFPLGLTGLIFLQSKGLSRVFSNITVQKHQFFGAQLSL